MNRLERLYALQEELRRRAPYPISASRLADQFEVTTRTIERDLASLRNAGVPIDGDVGRSGGYSLDKLPGAVVFTLGVEEVVAILLAAKATEGMPFTKASQIATQRLLDALPQATRVGVEELRSRIRTTDGATLQARPRVQRVIEEAVKHRLVLRISYTDASGIPTTRTVEAHGLYGDVDGWYLIAWCRLREAGRIFRLDRIINASLTKATASHRDVDDTLGWVPKTTAAP